MAVQKSKKTSSKRGMRRSHDHLDLPKLSQDPTSGETHMRHHVSKNGFYKGPKMFDLPLLSKMAAVQGYRNR